MGDVLGEGNEKPFWKRLGELTASSAFLQYISEQGSDRLTVSQAAFFMMAAVDDAAGTRSTRSQLLAKADPDFRPSIRNSYRQLLEPSRVYPNALSWLTTEVNSLDSREQLLCLTDLGKSVIKGALSALEAASKQR